MPLGARSSMTQGLREPSPQDDSDRGRSPKGSVLRHRRVSPRFGSGITFLLLALLAGGVLTAGSFSGPASHGAPTASLGVKATSIAAQGLESPPASPSSHSGHATTSTGSAILAPDAALPFAWENITSNLASSPPSRYGESIAYDPVSNSLVLFGGQGVNSNYLSDTWVYSNSRWSSETPEKPNSTNNPPARAGASMAFDPTFGGILLFGGKNGVAPFQDLWLFQGGNWSNLTSRYPSGPPARVYASMAFDSVDNEMLLFGGRNPTKVFGDTWALNSAQWTNVTPSPLTATNSPSHRYKSAMTYDSSDGYVLLFGGLTSSSAVSSGLNDTWRYESGHWSQVATTAAPSPRCSSAMSFDSTMDAVTLFGGSNQTGATFNDTWSYSAGQWINLSKNLSEIPPGRSMSSLALSTGAGTSGPYLLMFGGQLANGAVLGDTWLGGALPVQFVALRSTSTLLDAGQFLNLSAVAYGGLLPYTYTWNGLPAGCVSLNSSYIGCYPSKAEQYSEIGRAHV